MSRYSPQVQPDAGPDIGRGLVDAARLAYELRRQSTQDDRQRRHDEQQERDADLGYYAKGGRTGTAPVESPTTVTVPDVPTFNAPDPAMLAGILRGGTFERPGAVGETAPFAPPSDHDWARQLGPMIEQNGITGVPPSASMQPPGSMSAGSGTAGDRMASRNRAQTHPGAFDPATRSFGGSPVQQAIAAQHAGGGGGVASRGRTVQLENSTPRYAQLDAGHYVDTQHTPEAEHDRDRESQARLAAELRGIDIQTRGQQAQTLEQQKQQGRLAVRENINMAHVAEILARGDVTGKNQAAHDTRVDKRTAAHDARVTGAGGTKPMTVGQRETNARQAADGVIAATDGSYEEAIDWLENTPEGKQAAANGLEARHLYSALGKYHKLLSAEELRLQAGAASFTPEEAHTAVTTTHGRVGSGRQAPAGNAAEAAMSDADLWEAKVKAGMPKDSATAYVRNRKKKP